MLQVLDIGLRIKQDVHGNNSVIDGRLVLSIDLLEGLRPLHLEPIIVLFFSPKYILPSLLQPIVHCMILIMLHLEQMLCSLHSFRLIARLLVVKKFLHYLIGDCWKVVLLV
jgi:hypothetical protein